MENDIIGALASYAAPTRTENGAYAERTTGSAIVDLFAEMGALRSHLASDGYPYRLFSAAYSEDPSTAMRLLMMLRDPRSGLGERDAFREIAHSLAIEHPEAVRPIVPLFPKYGRFDDLYCLVGTPLEAAAMSFLRSRYSADVSALAHGESESISLLAKWLPSEGASSKATRSLARLTMSYFGESPRSYRRNLSSLRSALRVAECDMSASRWGAIDYASLPSRCMSTHRQAFARNDGGRFAAFMAAARSGSGPKPHSGTLYPYDLAHAYSIASCRPTMWGGAAFEEDPAIEAQWAALPDFLSDAGERILVMADTSGSMYSPLAGGSSVTPMEVASSLAIYFAERSKGAFANSFMAFSCAPRLVTLDPSRPLSQRLSAVMSDRLAGYNTDLRAAFMALLSAAVAKKVPQSGMPTAIAVISDMEIDDFGALAPLAQEMRRIYAEAGYELPRIAYWNVSARGGTFLGAPPEGGVTYLSGASASAFGFLCSGIGKDPLGAVMAALGDRYMDASAA